VPRNEEAEVSKDIELLTEIRDLLEVIAEPAIAKRDANLRASLRSVVGSSSKKAKTVLLIDGSRSQAAIAKESGLDAADASRLVKALGAAKLIVAGDKHPKLSLKIPPTFFDGDDGDE
jgi:hypothetical protein